MAGGLWEATVVAGRLSMPAALSAHSLVPSNLVPRAAARWDFYNHSPWPPAACLQAMFDAFAGWLRALGFRFGVTPVQPKMDDGGILGKERDCEWLVHCAL